MGSNGAKRPTCGAFARLLAVALHAALVMLLALGTPVLAGDPDNGNGNVNGSANGNANGNANGGGPDRTETPGNENDHKPTAEPQTPEPTRAPTPEPTVAVQPPVATAPAPPAAQAPVAPGPVAPAPATSAAPRPAALDRTPMPIRATAQPAAGITSGQPGPAARSSSGGAGARPDAPPSPVAPPGSLQAARAAAPLDDRDARGAEVASIAPETDIPVVPALLVLVAFASTAGGMVLVGRRRGDPAAQPAVVPIGLNPIQDVVPASDPLLAALQGSARFAPPDGTTPAASRATLGDGAPLWVRRLEPRIPVMSGTMSSPARRAEPDPELEDAVGF